MDKHIETEWSLGDFLIFTPFSNQEVAEALSLPLLDVALALETGALQTSIAGRDDPFGRLRLSSVWDIVEFELMLRAGWPFDIGPTMRTLVASLCEDLADRLEQGSPVCSEQLSDELTCRSCDCADQCQMCHLRDTAPHVFRKIALRLKAIATAGLRNAGGKNYVSLGQGSHPLCTGLTQSLAYMPVPASYEERSNAAQWKTISAKHNQNPL